MKTIQKLLYSFIAVTIFVACKDDDDPIIVDETVTEINGTSIDAVNNMIGIVTDASGKGIAGVPVTDGYYWTTTDANGVYQFEGDAMHARNVYITVPADYKVPLDENHYPKFYGTNIEREGVSRNDFVLESQSVQDNFTLVMIGDPQCKTDAQVNRFTTETLADITSTVSSEGFQNVYAFTLGDITYDNVTEWDPMVTAMSNLSDGNGGYIPIFQCIGNHDHDAAEQIDYNATNNFVKLFGPTDYSVNIGKAHIIVMDDVIGLSTNGKTWTYSGGFSKYQYEWLKGDLSMVSDKEDKLVIFCTHIPFRGGASDNSGSSVNTDQYYSEVLELLTDFKEAHIMIGHTHYTQNYVHTDLTTQSGLPIYEHVHGAACGAWWNSNSTVTGEPNGYTIYSIEGNQLSDWIFKGTNKDKEFQMRVFDGNQIYGSKYQLNWYTVSQTAGMGNIAVRGNALTKNCFVADVFDDDDSYWKVELFKDGVKIGDFKRLPNGSLCNIPIVSYYFNVLGKNSSTWASKVASHYWYCPAPSGNPSEETGWEVRATQTIPSSGKTNVYTCSTLQTTYEGF